MCQRQALRCDSHSPIVCGGGGGNQSRRSWDGMGGGWGLRELGKTEMETTEERKITITLESGEYGGSKGGWWWWRRRMWGLDGTESGRAHLGPGGFGFGAHG